jgi:hypothetical protein
MLAGDDLDQQLAAHLAGGLIERGGSLASCCCLQFGRIIRVVEGQALDAVIDRPVDKA